jgi:hypothetical protein
MRAELAQVIGQPVDTNAAGHLIVHNGHDDPACGGLISQLGGTCPVGAVEPEPALGLGVDLVHHGAQPGHEGRVSGGCGGEAVDLHTAILRTRRGHQ